MRLLTPQSSVASADESAMNLEGLGLFLAIISIYRYIFARWE
jgi:hypothetical protein